MTEFRARIRSVRMKGGGASVRILPTPEQHDGENWNGKLIENAKHIAGYEGEMDGYLVLGLFADGTRSMGFRLPRRIPRELWPAYVAEVLRTDLITEWEAEGTFHRIFEWVD